MRTVLVAVTTVMLCAVAFSQEIELKGYSLAEWAALIKAEDKTALHALRWAGDDSNDLLMALLDDPSPVVRRHALWGLVSGWSNRERPLSMPRLASFLEDRDPRVRASSARALAECGALRILFLEDLLANLSEEDEDARYALVYALGRLGEPAVRALGKSLSDPSATVRSGAAAALGEFEASPEAAVRALLAATRDDDAGVRTEVARSLGELHFEAETSVPVLAGMLRDESVAVREAAALALARFWEDALPAGDALAAALSDADEEVRVAAAGALCRLGEHAAGYVPELLAALDDPKPEVRSEAVSILGESESPTDETILAIARLVGDPDTDVRYFAASSLRNLGTLARLAIPAVVRSLAREYPRDDAYLRGFFNTQVARSIQAMLAALEDADEEVRYAGLRGLRLMGRVPVPKELARVLREDPSTRNREVAARILEKLGERAWKATPDIAAALSDSDRAVRVAAEGALASVGEKALPAVLTLLSSGNAADRARGWSIISRMSPDVRLSPDILGTWLALDEPEDRLPAAANLFRVGGEQLDLIERTMDEDPSALVRIAAARSWVLRTAEGGPAVPVLVRALDAEERAHRRRAAQVLVEIAAKGKLDIEIAYRLLDDPDLVVRKAAVNCLPIRSFTARSRAGVLAGLNFPTARPSGVYSFTSSGFREPPNIRLLIWAACHSPSDFRWTAIRDLGVLGADARPSRPALARILDDQSERVREWAARGLAKLPGSDGGAVEELRAALEDENPAVRADAALAHFRSTGSAEIALRALRKQLEDPDADDRWQAVRALREMGAGIEEVRAALAVAAKDEDEIVRLAARAALDAGEGDR